MKPYEGPIGELTWTGVVTTFPVDAIPGFLDGLEWWNLADFPLGAPEWALAQCIDEAGQRWTRVGDARELADVIATGVTAVPHYLFPGLLPGWFDGAP